MRYSARFQSLLTETKLLTVILVLMLFFYDDIKITAILTQSSVVKAFQRPISTQTNHRFESLGGHFKRCSQAFVNTVQSRL